MISNSVTHLQCWYNSADDIGSERRCLCIECRYHRIEWRVVECFMMFHNVLREFHDVLLVVHDVLIVVYDVSQCFTVYLDVLLCLTIFYDA